MNNLLFFIYCILIQLNFITYANNKSLSDTAFFYDNSILTFNDFKKRELLIQFCLNNFKKTQYLVKSNMPISKKLHNLREIATEDLIKGKLLRLCVKRNNKKIHNLFQKKEIDEYRKKLFTNNNESNYFVQKLKSNQIELEDLNNWIIEKILEENILYDTFEKSILPSNTDFQKIPFMYDKQNIKVNDIRIIYDSFCIFDEKEYDILLKQRTMPTKDKIINKKIKYKRHSFFLSENNQKSDLNNMLFHMYPGQTTKILHENKKIYFVRLLEYEIIGIEKKYIEKYKEPFKLMYLEIFKSKFYKKLEEEFKYQLNI